MYIVHTKKIEKQQQRKQQNVIDKVIIRKFNQSMEMVGVCQALSAQTVTKIRIFFFINTAHCPFNKRVPLSILLWISNPPHSMTLYLCQSSLDKYVLAPLSHGMIWIQKKWCCNLIWEDSCTPSSSKLTVFGRKKSSL